MENEKMCEKFVVTCAQCMAAQKDLPEGTACTISRIAEHEKLQQVKKIIKLIAADEEYLMNLKPFECVARVLYLIYISPLTRAERKNVTVHEEKFMRALRGLGKGGPEISIRPISRIFKRSTDTVSRHTSNEQKERYSL